MKLILHSRQLWYVYVKLKSFHLLLLQGKKRGLVEGEIRRQWEKELEVKLIRSCIFLISSRQNKGKAIDKLSQAKINVSALSKRIKNYILLR